MQQKRIDEHACAVLALSTCLAWSQEFGQPLSRAAVRRMLETGALSGLVLRDVPGIEPRLLERARILLSRVSDVYDRLEEYRIAGYRLLFPGRDGWPQELSVLGQKEPLFLFAKGKMPPLEKRRIAVAGSRQLLRETYCAAQQIGRMIAREGMALVSGGAQGADSAAQRGALEEGGEVIIVPAVPAAQLLHSRALAAAMEEERLLVLCDTLPDEPFSAAKALSRNHTLYALGSAAMLVAAREGVGGSWRGASDCLRGDWRSVYVWEGQNADTVGNRALMQRGARSYSLDRPIASQLCTSKQEQIGLQLSWRETHGNPDYGYTAQGSASLPRVEGNTAG